MTYQAPPPGSYPGAPMGGGEHPKAQSLLIWSIVGLICCWPINVWVLVTANGILQAPGGYETSKVNTARIIAIVSFVLWAIGLIYNLIWGSWGTMLGINR